MDIAYLYFFGGVGIDSLRSVCFMRRTCRRTPLDRRLFFILLFFLVLFFNRLLLFFSSFPSMMNCHFGINISHLSIYMIGSRATSRSNSDTQNGTFSRFLPSCGGYYPLVEVCETSFTISAVFSGRFTRVATSA